MRSTIFTLLCSFFSLTLFAQRPEYDWQLQAGLNIIDLYPVGKSSTYFPNQGNFLEGIANTNHWNFGVPALGLFRTIDENLSAGLVLGFAGVTEIEGQASEYQLLHRKSAIKIRSSTSKNTQPLHPLGTWLFYF